MTATQVQIADCLYDNVQNSDLIGGLAPLDLELGSAKEPCGAMIEYRLYFLDGAGHITSREEFDAPTDKDALTHAKQII